MEHLKFSSDITSQPYSLCCARLSASFRLAFAVALFNCLAVVAAAQVGPAPAAVDDSSACREIVAALRGAIVLGQPFQPTAEQEEKFSRIAYPTEAEAAAQSNRQPSDGPMLAKSSMILVRDHLPYYPYVYLADTNGCVVHPMALGRYILNRARDPSIHAIMKAARSIAVEIPNGGRAWYYPRHYRNARMQGPDIRYSCISQGTLLAGFTAAALHNDDIDFDLAKHVMRAMEFPFEKGGINLADRALLELPSYRAPPEIILNGWLDALFHLGDYARLSNDKEATALLQKNLHFLAQVVHVFDAPEAQVSRYCDVSPYRVDIEVSDAAAMESLRVLYLPKIPELPAFIVPLKIISNQQKASNYDNQILRIKGRNADAWISCSQLFSTNIVSTAVSMTVNMETGTIDPRQTSPGLGGDKLTLQSQPCADVGSYVRIEDSNNLLIRGYPTNFLKPGNLNVYHVYHVIALMLLARSGDMQPQDERVVLDMAHRWLGYVQNAQLPAPLKFEDFQDVLDGINRNRVQSPTKDANELIEWSRRRVVELVTAETAAQSSQE